MKNYRVAPTEESEEDNKFSINKQNSIFNWLGFTILSDNSRDLYDNVNKLNQTTEEMLMYTLWDTNKFYNAVLLFCTYIIVDSQ